MITQLHVRDCLKTGVFPFSKGPGFETKAMVLHLIDMRHVARYTAG